MDVGRRIARSLGTSASIGNLNRGVWAAGIHPEYIGQYNEQKWQQVLASFDDAFSGDHAARAVGEIGIQDTQTPQIELNRKLCEQLEIARRWKANYFPLKRARKMLNVLKRFGKLPAGGVIHGFTGGPETTDRYVKLGLHLGINGRWLHGGASNCGTLKRAQLDHCY